MLQIATADMLPQLKKLWQVCFKDTAAGTDFIFDNLLHTERILVQTDNANWPVAMLCWHLLFFATQKDVFNSAYIFGVGTHPEHRGKGLSTALLERAEEILRERGVRVSCLVPASESLFNFYRQRGYETQFYYKLLRVGAEQMPVAALGGELAPTSLEDFVETRYLGSFADSSLLGVWDKDYLRYTSEECRFWGGEVLRFDGERMANLGYAVCYPDGKGSVLVKEIALQWGYKEDDSGELQKEDFDELLAALHERYKAQSYQLRLRADFNLANKWATQTLPFAMTKWYYKEDAQTAPTGGAPWFAFGLDS